MAKVHTISKLFKNTKALLFIVALLLVSTFSSYVYLVNKTVMNVVARQQAQKDIAVLSSAIGEQEFKYITLKNNVTLELAYQKGFSDATPTSFLAQNKASSPLSYNSTR